MELAAGARIDPDRISFLKVLKHVRRTVIARTVTTATKMMDFMDTLASKVSRKLDSGPRRPRVADRLLKRPDSKYSYRAKGQLWTHPQGTAQDYHSASSNTSVAQATALPGHPQMDLPEPDSSAAGQRRHRRADRAARHQNHGWGYQPGPRQSRDHVVVMV